MAATAYYDIAPPQATASSTASSSSRNEESEQPPTLKPTVNLTRSLYVPVIVSLYTVTCCLVWILICYMAFRPLTTRKYGVWMNDETDCWFLWDEELAAPDGELISPEKSTLHKAMVKNEKWFQAIRVVQAIINVLTIPLTSAVCASAAVTYAQNTGSQKQDTSKRLTLRQLLALADRTWTDPGVYCLITRYRKQYSSFLGLAMLIHVIGFLIAPLQQIYLSTTSISTPQMPEIIGGVVDLPDQWSNPPQRFSVPDSVIVATRNKLISSGPDEPQTLLWPGNSNLSCNLFDPKFDFKINNSAIWCGSGTQATLGQITRLDNPFISPLGNNFNTGLTRQFLLRINSTAVSTSIPEIEFPSDCSNIPGALFLDYASTSDLSFWTIQICILAGQWQSPWRRTRDRQDFSEIMYMNLSRYRPSMSQPAAKTYSIAVDTTAGYFELPNIMNGNQAGILLDRDPTVGVCGEDCPPQSNFRSRELLEEGGYTENEPSPFNISQCDDSSTPCKLAKNGSGLVVAESIFNKGPLLTTALALFGTGSFLSAGYIYAQMDKSPIIVPGHGDCYGAIPLRNFLTRSTHDHFASCSEGWTSREHLDNKIHRWIDLLINCLEEDLSNIFTAAAFLSNEAWLANTELNRRTFQVWVDHGASIDIPDISKSGIIIISLILSCHLIGLWTFTLYSYLPGQWTSRLDSLTMLQLGASVAEKFPLKIVPNKHNVSVLDDISGTIGAIQLEDGLKGITLGGSGALDRKSRYEAFEVAQGRTSRWTIYKRRRNASD